MYVWPIIKVLLYYEDNLKILYHLDIVVSCHVFLWTHEHKWINETGLEVKAIFTVNQCGNLIKTHPSVDLLPLCWWERWIRDWEGGWAVTLRFSYLIYVVNVHTELKRQNQIILIYYVIYFLCSKAQVAS